MHQIQFNQSQLTYSSLIYNRAIMQAVIRYSLLIFRCLGVALIEWYMKICRLLSSNHAA